MSEAFLLRIHLSFADDLFLNSDALKIADAYQNLKDFPGNRII